MYCYPMLYPPSHHREEDHRRHVFGKVARPMHDQLRSNQSGQRRRPAPVRPVAIDRSDRSPLTGQTGLIRDRTKLILQDRFTVSMRRKKRYNPLLIQKKLKPMMFCISAISKWLSMMRVQDQWFLVNRSILLFKGRSWLMIMRLAVVTRHQSTFNQDGVLQD